MTGEINRDFYCLTNFCDEKGYVVCSDYFTSEDGGSCNKYCSYRRRKWPTPEQFEEKYGKAYPDDGAVYAQIYEDGGWIATDFSNAKHGFDVLIVCACTPFGKPPDDWRPE